MKKPVAEKKPIVVKAGGTTAKIYSGQSGGYPLYTLVYYLGGRRVRKTFSDVAEARREGELAVTKVESGQGGVLELRSSDRDSYVQAMRELQPLEIPLHSAIAEFVAATRLLNGVSILEPVINFGRGKVGGEKPQSLSDRCDR